MKIRHLILLLIGVGMLFAVFTPAAADDGEQLYQTHCSGCHGMDGQGFRRLYPALHGSLYFDQKLMQLPCIIQNGLTGTIRLQNGTYNQTMPGNRSLNAEQIALLLRYTSRFSTSGPAEVTTITPEQVEYQLKQCARNTK